MDIVRVMEELAKTNALFRDEKDFRVNLGRTLTQLYPESELRYDASGFYSDAKRVDILTTHEDMRIGIELKYKWVVKGNTAPFVYDGKEFWGPKSGSPDDVTRFKFLEDLQKLETVTMNRSDIAGYSILLTNKQGLWNPGRKRKPNDLMFRVDENRGMVHGKLKWIGNPAKKTLEMTGNSITIRGKYSIQWRRYVEIPSMQSGLFKYLTIKAQ